jgi:hypothetical protein
MKTGGFGGFKDERQIDSHNRLIIGSINEPGLSVELGSNEEIFNDDKEETREKVESEARGSFRITMSMW